MTIYVLQYRTTGEDYQVATFRTLRIAQLAAYQFLCVDVLGMEEHQSYAFNYTTQQLNDVVNQCADRDLAYIEITTHTI